MSTTWRNPFVAKINDEWEEFHTPLVEFDDDPYTDEECKEATRDYVTGIIEEGLEI